MLYHWATDSKVGEVNYEVHMTRVLHPARISNVDNVMFVNRIREMVNFELDKEIEHRSAESEGLRFDSSWGVRIVFFFPRSWQDEKHLSHLKRPLPSNFFLKEQLIIKKKLDVFLSVSQGLARTLYYTHIINKVFFSLKRRRYIRSRVEESWFVTLPGHCVEFLARCFILSMSLEMSNSEQTAEFDEILRGGVNLHSTQGISIISGPLFARETGKSWRADLKPFFLFDNRNSSQKLQSI